MKHSKGIHYVQMHPEGTVSAELLTNVGRGRGALILRFEDPPTRRGTSVHDVKVFLDLASAEQLATALEGAVAFLRTLQ